MDYFAGSGTTALAVITLNRIDQINRKFVIVDSGYYFDTVTIERIKKYIYSSDWENGKPQNRDTGVSQIIKYMRLESYEDALSNIEFNSEETGWTEAALPMEDKITYVSYQKKNNRKG